MQPRNTHRRRGRGFLLIETLISLALLMLIFTMLGATITHQRRVSRVLADDRAAVRLAERVLAGVALDEVTLADPQINVRVEPLEVAGGEGESDRQWARVTVTCRSRMQSLVGLMPRQLVHEHAEVLP